MSKSKLNPRQVSQRERSVADLLWCLCSDNGFQLKPRVIPNNSNAFVISRDSFEHEYVVTVSLLKPSQEKSR